jgi:hypothetical protein
MEPRRFQPFEQMLARLPPAELSGEKPRIKERPEARDDNALTLGVLVPP